MKALVYIFSVAIMIMVIGILSSCSIALEQFNR